MFVPEKPFVYAASTHSVSEDTFRRQRSKAGRLTLQFSQASRHIELLYRLGPILEDVYVSAADSLFVLREAESEEHLFMMVFFDKDHSDSILLTPQTPQFL